MVAPFVPSLPRTRDRLPESDFRFSPVGGSSRGIEAVELLVPVRNNDPCVNCARGQMSGRAGSGRGEGGGGYQLLTTTL